MAGLLTSVSANTMTGNVLIDALLYPNKWNVSSITFSDPNHKDDYQSGYYKDQDNDDVSAQEDSFSQITYAQKLAAYFALETDRFDGNNPAGAGFSVEGFTNLGVSYAGSGSGAGTIRIANSDDPSPGTSGYASYPAYNIYGGDVFIENYPGATDPYVGDFGWEIMLHEVGHALGLKHAHLPQGSNLAVLPVSYNSFNYTVMTYVADVGGADVGGPWYASDSAPQTYMMLDILALQTMYGADYTTNSGNTVYKWNPYDGRTYVNGQIGIDRPIAWEIFATIWDGGGVDTYDLSSYSDNLTIDLRPGEFSTFSTIQLATLASGGAYALGNIANAMLFNNDTRSLIENATGGSGNDIITGNTAGNNLIGNSGNDTIWGLAGNDILSGGNGDDYLDGGTGIDQMIGGYGDDTYFVNSPLDTINEAVGQGNDSLVLRSNYTLYNQSIENIGIAVGTGITVVANSYDQFIAGGAGNDRIDGKGGIDTVVGHGGNDTFVFSSAISSANLVTIDDFTVGADKIELARAVFSALNAGSALLASGFHTGSSSADASDRIIYDPTNGNIYYDSDGTGSASQKLFAILDQGLALTSASFTIV